MSLTYNELKQQYMALEQTIDCVNANFQDIKEFIDGNKPEKIIYLGCGSSYSIAESIAVTTQMHLKMPAFAIAAGDLMLHVDRYEGFFANSLVIAISRSGNTSELVISVKEIKERMDVPVLSVVCTEDSKLSIVSDRTVLMPWAFDASVCQTRTVSCLYMMGVLLVAKLAGNTALEKDLHRAVELGPQYMERYEELFKRVADISWENAVVLGDAELAGIACEGSLAFKEICQLPSNYYHMLDSRHGPFVMIGKNTFVIVILSDSNNAYEADLVNELVKKGATVLCCSDLPPVGIDELVIEVNFGEPLHHAARGIPFILIAQMTAYYKALARGVNPDFPDGLEAWIRL